MKCDNEKLFSRLDSFNTVHLSEPDEDECVSPDLTLKWNKIPSATSYTLELSSSTDFTEPLYSLQTSNNNYQINTQEIELEPTQYYWRVQANCNEFDTEYSALSSFHVLDEEIIYVWSNYQGTSCGNQSAPYATITDGMLYALNRGIDILYIADGTYNESITINRKTCLYGGYDHQTWLNDANNNESNILGTDTSAITLETVLANDSIIRGFTFNKGVSSDTVMTGIACNTNVSAVIANNIIYGSTGIICQKSSSPVIINNVINVSGTATTYGIQCQSYSTPIIRNNTINGGNGDSSIYGIYNTLQSSPVVENNIIFTESSDAGNCLLYDIENNLNNNDFFNCTDEVDHKGNGNINNYPHFINIANNDWRLTENTHINISQGGLCGNDYDWGFTQDILGEQRTNELSGTPFNIAAGGWSMGAYEYDDSALADTSSISGSIIPANESIIFDTDKLVITFTKSIDENTLAIGGTIQTDFIVQLSDTYLVNDTLTIQPKERWNGGTQTISIEAEDIFDIPVSLLYSYNILDTNPVSSTINPEYGEQISDTQIITIAFNKPIDKETLILSGTLLENEYLLDWQSNTYSNDTLILMPNTIWIAGENETLRYQVTDIYGIESNMLIMNYLVVATPVSATIVPDHGAIITSTQPIVITTNKSMDPDTVVILGNIIDNSYTLTWDTISYSNDKLTIKPDSEWSAGLNKILIIELKDIYNIEMNPITNTYNVLDNSVLSYVVDPDDTSLITSTQAIKVQFTKSIETDNLILDGSLSTSEYSTSFSTTLLENDTLTITPDSVWNEGSSKALIISVEDIYGIKLEQVEITYDILNAILYVSNDTGDDSNPGTQEEPKQTIQSAIQQAGELFTLAEIRVAKGLFNVDSQSDEHILLQEGLSLYGGYTTSNWTASDVQTNTTIIQDISIDEDGLNKAIEIPENITKNTAIDGFIINGGGGSLSCAIEINNAAPVISNNTLNGGTGAKSYAIYCNNSSPEINNNDIDGGKGSTSFGIFLLSSYPDISENTISGGDGTGSSYGVYNNNSHSIISENSIDGGSTGDFTYGIYNASSSCTIEYNTIDAGNSIKSSYALYEYNCSSEITGNTIKGNGTNAFYSYGIYNGNSDSSIINNLIDAGSADNYSYGIYNSSSSNTILNNIINGGSEGNYSFGIYNISYAASTIKNNIIFTMGGWNRYGIYEYDANSSPVCVLNNDIFDCEEGLYYDDGSVIITDSNFNTQLITTGEVNQTLGYLNNITLDPQFENRVNGNWYFTSSSPCEVTTGGLDLSDTFNKDKDRNTRTTNWSIGAFEYDETCN